MSYKTFERILFVVVTVIALVIVAWLWSGIAASVEEKNRWQAEVNEQVRVCIQETGRDLPTCYFMVTGIVIDGD